MNKPPAGFKRPFKTDSMSMYIWDAQGYMAADVQNQSLRARGWGRIQYLDNPHVLMDKWEAWVAQRTYGILNFEDAVEQLNAV